MLSKLPFAWSIGGVAVLVISLPQAAIAQLPEINPSNGQKMFRISGRVLKSSGTRDVYVALWQADGFMEKPVRQIHIKAGADATYLFEVPAGRWAVSAYEDTNGNGILDMGAFGPKEQSGFWRAFSGWRKPRFDDVCTPVTKETSGADITLK